MRHSGKALALGLGLGWALTFVIGFTQMVGTPVDAACYYGMDPANPYDPARCFLYSPPIAQLLPFVQGAMSFEVFYTSLRALEMAALAVIVGPAIGPALFIPAVAVEINAANINILLVGAVLLGFRYPWMWAFPILTKVTPGIGLLWFAARREWRHLAIALGLTLGISAVSVVLVPGMWGDYLVALTRAPDESVFKLWWRLPIAAAVVIWGARTDRRWAVIIAVFLAMPRWYYLSPVILVGLFPLVRLPRPLPWPRWRDRTAQAAAVPSTEAGSSATARSS